MLTINAFAASDSVLIPVQAAYLPVRGLEQLIMTISRVKKHINPTIHFEGILISMVDSRTVYAREIIELVKENYGESLRIFDTMIPFSVRAAETSATGVSIYQLYPEHKVVKAYEDLTGEVIASAYCGRKGGMAMSRKDVTGKIKLNRFDELFGAGTTEEVHEGDSEIKEIPLAELHEFKYHPFKIRPDGELAEMIESVRQHGALVPGITRTRPEGGYEIFAGYTRRHICEIVGLKTMPMFVRELNDDEACVIMVDSNIQRENILPSEKAKAYKMKYETMKNQGLPGNSLKSIGEENRENYKAVQRYIWLARLNAGLLQMLDNK